MLSSWFLSDPLREYLQSHTGSTSLSQVKDELRQATRAMPNAIMQIAPEQGQFMSVLVRLMGAQRILEIGTFTGYSSLCLAEALPDKGVLITCDYDETSTALARTFWKKAGVDHKITLKLGPAKDTLQKLKDTLSAPFDMVFIDADKPSLRTYYELALSLLKTGGLVLVDNVLWNGSVYDDTSHEESTVSIRAFNDFVRTDPRVAVSMIPLGDGLTLACKL